MTLDQYIDEHRQDLIEIAKRLCSIESVKTEPAAENAPFGDGCRRVLDEMLSLCREAGFEIHDAQGYAGHAQMGEGEGLVGIMVHLDVVPVGDGWSSPPFEAAVVDGRLIARGAQDNKGPAVAVFLAMKAIAAYEVPLKKRVRLIFGCDEENGMKDLEYYFEHNEMPEIGFSPDAQYPVINCEKHILHSILRSDVKPSGLIKGIEAGTRFNVVPETATVYLSEPLDAARRRQAVEYAVQMGVQVDIMKDRLVVYGVSAHASTPNEGVNAAQHLLQLADRMRLAEGESRSALQALAKLLKLETNGAGLGMRFTDNVSGALTNNLGILKLDEEGLRAYLDMRCPVEKTKEELVSALENAAEQTGFGLEVANWQEGIYVDSGSELVQALLDAYHRQTGDEKFVLAIGGGTYARMMPGRAVAFGARFPHEKDLSHQRDESVDVDSLLKSAKIFAHAIARLAG
ncbi:MAG: dipeptidase PepV [Christensenellales bacterium]|jgi:succinyl-diaminopimelate desuccinylase